MEDGELPYLENDLREIFKNYDSTLREHGIRKEIRYRTANNFVRSIFYVGTTNTSDYSLKYEDFEYKEEEEGKIDRKIDCFEKILKEYTRKN